jgi:hypothetical protein
MEDQFYKLIDVYNDSLDKLVQFPIYNPEEWLKVGIVQRFRSYFLVDGALQRRKNKRHERRSSLT